ncbi:class I SAM-dependent methyltransferase [Hydrogenobacter thermophilus]|uniref:class I SAM-dependent methyltransferase n=1 Tax=Hydrogenobacter thermophilus TaxID=940 RepID=UPI0030FB481C
MNQLEVFKSQEADRWFERNRESLKPKDDVIVWLLDTYGLLNEKSSVLEVGASNGYRLARLYEKYACRCVAVEPSQKAVEDGKKSFPFLEFYPTTAEEMDFSEEFDLIIVNSVFHWIDRKNLFKVVANIDKALKEGGALVIGDFQLPVLLKNPYHHVQEEVYTYKQPYKELFLSSGLYLELASFCYNHDTKEFKEINLANLFCVSLLRKQELYLRQDKVL